MLLPKVSKQVSFAFRRGTALAEPRVYFFFFRGQKPDKNGVLWGGGWGCGGRTFEDNGIFDGVFLKMISVLSN